MILSKSDFDVIKGNQSSFISFKFVSDLGRLLSIDSLVHSNLSLNFVIGGKSYLLKPFLSFDDPFRSRATTSFLCEDLNSIPNYRQSLIEVQDNWKVSMKENKFEKRMMARVSFCATCVNSPLRQSIINETALGNTGGNKAEDIGIFEDHTEISNTKLSLEIGLQRGYNEFGDQVYSLCSQPIDAFADMRADMVQAMHDVGINVDIHYHGIKHGESIIGIVENDLVKLADDIVLALYIIKNVAAGYGMMISFQGNSNLSLEVFEGVAEDVKHISLNDCRGIKSQNYSFDLGSDGDFNPYIRFLECLKIHKI